MPVTPDYVRIADDTEADIRSGALQPGDKLPSIKELCENNGVGETTIKLVFVRLEARGLIYRHQGKGTYVTPTDEWWPKPNRR